MLLVLAVTTFNIILNIILVPVMGIAGAAITTTTSYILYAIIGSIYTQKTLKVKYPWTLILKYLICAIIMYYAVTAASFGTWGLAGVTIGKIIVGILSYSLLILIFDNSWIRKVIKT